MNDNKSNIITLESLNSTTSPDFTGFQIAAAYLEKFGAASALTVDNARMLPGFDFDDYPYHNLPLGQFPVHLDCKVWAKARALRCFLRFQDGRGMCLSVWHGDYYCPAESEVALNKTPVGTWLMVETAKRKTNDNIFWKSAAIIE